MKDWRDYPNGKEKYGLYLASREWAVMKHAVNARSGGVCERCKRAPAENVHHQTYDSIYAEQLEDLVHLCRPCHEFVSDLTPVDPRTSGRMLLHLQTVAFFLKVLGVEFAIIENDKLVIKFKSKGPDWDGFMKFLHQFMDDCEEDIKKFVKTPEN
jgi:hypothetical protein